MEDLIGASMLAIECVIVMLVLHYTGLAVPFAIAAAVFVLLAFIGLGVWDEKTAKEWRKLAIRSVILGIVFFGSDILLAHLNGQKTFQSLGGLFGLPVTFATWGYAMVSVAGLTRALYRDSAG